MANEQLFYDDNCSMCSHYSEKFLKNGVLPEGQICGLTTMGQNNKIDENRARNEMPLYLPDEDRTIYGVDTLIYLLRKKRPLMARIVSSKVIYPVARHIYKTIAYNRQFIAKSYRTKKPETQAKYHAGYRWVLIMFCVVTSTIVTGLFALQFTTPTPILLAIGLGWVLFFASTLLISSREERMRVAGHTSIVMFRGVVIFGFCIPFLGFWPIASYAMALFIITSFIDMNFQMIRRMGRAKRTGLYFVWLGCLLGTSTTVLTWFDYIHLI